MTYVHHDAAESARLFRRKRNLAALLLCAGLVMLAVVDTLIASLLLVLPDPHSMTGKLVAVLGVGLFIAGLLFAGLGVLAECLSYREARAGDYAEVERLSAASPAVAATLNDWGDHPLFLAARDLRYVRFIASQKKE